MRGIIHWDPPPSVRDHAGRPPALHALANLLDWGVQDILFAAPPAPLAALQDHLANGSDEFNCAYALLPEAADPAAALFAALEFSAGHACILASGMRCLARGDWKPEIPRRGMHEILPNTTPEAEPLLHCYAPTSLRPLLNMHRTGTPPNLQRLTATWKAQGHLRRIILPDSVRWYDASTDPASPQHPDNAPPGDLMGENGEW